MKKLTAYQRKIFNLILNGTLATMALLFSVVSYTYITQKNYVVASIFLVGSSFLLGAIYFIKLFFEERNKIKALRLYIISGLYLVLAIVAGFISLHYYFLNIYALVLSLIIITSGVTHIIENHHSRSILSNSLKIIFGIACSLLFANFNMTEEEIAAVFVFTSVILGVIAFSLTIGAAFSGIKRKTLMKILRKTYSVEIFYGMLVLIVSVAIVLYALEDGITSIADALWYCFAVVTTIGFGDITAVTTIGRILTVVLGVYGLIVVALLTSIIVNFYTETKSKETEEETTKEETKETDKKE